MVRSRSGVRASRHAPVCSILLPACHGAAVSAFGRTLAAPLTVRIRPYDVRIWQAQGMCYEEMGRYVPLQL